MSTPVTIAAPAAAGAPARGYARAVLRVIAFWWLATGAIVALQRNSATRWVALFAATALAAVGVRLLIRSRDDRSRAGAERAFLGGALLWLFVAATFYGGWIVGPTLDSLSADGPGLRTAALAIKATAYHELLGVAMICLAFALHGRNPVGWRTLAIFWGADQLARLNIFFGVANPGIQFLPADLAFLGAFFGPPRTSALLVPSVIALALAAAVTLWRGLRVPDEFRRTMAAMTAVLLALAALEHAVLGMNWSLPFWDLFLRAREA